MTDTNREIANKELSSTFNGTMSSFIVPTISQDGFSNIPSPESIEQSGNQVNNFNVNVNIAGDQKLSQVPAVQAKAEQIIQNVLGTSSPLTSASDIKKNYNIGLGQDLNRVNFAADSNPNLNSYTSIQSPSLNILESNSTNYQTATPIPETNLRNNNELKLNDLQYSTPQVSSPIVSNYEENHNKNFERSAFGESLITHKMHSYMESDGDFLPGLNVQNLTFNTPNMEHYTYSIASLKQDNPVIKNRYEYIKNIIHKTLGQVSNDQMRQSIKNELFTTEQNNFNSFMNQQNLYFESGDQKIHEIEQQVRSYHQNKERLAYETDKAIMEGKREVGRRITEDRELNGELNNNSFSMGDVDDSPTIPQRNDPEDYNHLNNFSLNDSFLSEINSPPLWRTVYG